jgi:hypothetical protein
LVTEQKNLVLNRGAGELFNRRVDT